MQMTTNGNQRKSQILGPAANGKTETARIRKKKINRIRKCQAASGTGTGKTQMLPHGLLDTGPRLVPRQWQLLLEPFKLKIQ